MRLLLLWRERNLCSGKIWQVFDLLGGLQYGYLKGPSGNFLNCTPPQCTTSVVQPIHRDSRKNSWSWQNLLADQHYLCKTAAHPFRTEEVSRTAQLACCAAETSSSSSEREIAASDQFQKIKWYVGYFINVFFNMIFFHDLAKRELPPPSERHLIHFNSCMCNVHITDQAVSISCLFLSLFSVVSLFILLFNYNFNIFY